MTATLDLFAPATPTPPVIRPGFDTGIAPAPSTAAQITNGVYPTPMWVANALVEQFFPELDDTHRVLEPTCGSGRFLRAIPVHVPAMGVELDAARAAEACRISGREVVVGDFRTVPLHFQPTHVCGNPPFKMDIVAGILDRCHELLPPDGRVGFILPCYFLQTAHTVREFNRKWGIEQHMIPRNIFPGLEKPLAWVMFSRSRARALVGFALYHETADVRDMPARYRSILADGRTTSVWAQLVDEALAALGGEATTAAIIREATARRDADLAESNSYPAAKIRQTLQRHFVQTAHGRWSRLPAEVAA